MSAPQILATGRCLPARVVTNEELSGQVDTTDQWVFSRTGIHQRHFCTDETGLDLAVSAARQSAAIPPPRKIRPPPRQTATSRTLPPLLPPTTPISLRHRRSSKRPRA